MLITPKLIYTFNQIPTKIPMELFLKFDEILSSTSRKIWRYLIQVHDYRSQNIFQNVLFQEHF